MIIEDASENAPTPWYHNGTGWRKRYPKTAPGERTFVVWDGEGITDAPHKPQNYVLFGCYDGVEHSYISGARLTTTESLEFIIAQGRAHPGAYHVAFYFDYDTNMILRNLGRAQFQRLRNTGRVRIGVYSVEHLPGKWLQVSWKNPLNPNDRITVKIQDASGFYQTSLVKALASNLAPDHPLMAAHYQTVMDMKARRQQFTREDTADILHYWKVENELFHALMLHLREMMYSVGMEIRSWYGPGVLANYNYRTRGIMKHKAEPPPAVYDAARYAYAGGRFELFRVGRHEKAYGIDINSAYPNAISRLPSLAEGFWQQVESPTVIKDFAMYHVRMTRMDAIKAPSPLFHRDPRGNISFPHKLEGWYWGPEVKAALTHGNFSSRTFQVLEGWEFIGTGERPFAWVADMYEERRAMKRAGNGAQLAIKLALNSLYGKMAQRVGWERKGAAPTWHQLEWAGYVTSYTRAMLYDVMARIPWEHLIAVETDGIYTTLDPREIGIEESGELGGWDRTEYDDMVYLQSGVYAKQERGIWTSKYRGLDSDSLTTEQIVNHARLLRANEDWPALVGRTTRFIGYSHALMRARSEESHFKIFHCKWETSDKDIAIGAMGKRKHVAKRCAACREGLSAYERPHDLFIASTATLVPHSSPHDIPWLDRPEDAPDWRTADKEMEGLLHAE